MDSVQPESSAPNCVHASDFISEVVNVSTYLHFPLLLGYPKLPLATPNRLNRGRHGLQLALPRLHLCN